jgi:rare lipoprotein A
MQKSVLNILTLSLGISFAVTANAELVQTQPLATGAESANLANRVLDRDNQNVSSALFKMNTQATSANTAGNAQTAKAATAPLALSITETTGSRTKVETVPARIEVGSSKADDEDDGIINRLSAVASQAVKKFSQTGLASWYGRQFHGRKTANGDQFDMYAMTAAHRSLPLNCYIRVTNQDNGKSVVVKVNDRGPFHGNRVLDLSYAAATQLGITQKGVGNVTIERIESPR